MNLSRMVPTINHVISAWHQFQYAFVSIGCKIHTFLYNRGIAVDGIKDGLELPS